MPLPESQILWDYNKRRQIHDAQQMLMQPSTHQRALAISSQFLHILPQLYKLPMKRLIAQCVDLMLLNDIQIEVVRARCMTTLKFAQPLLDNYILNQDSGQAELSDGLFEKVVFVKMHTFFLQLLYSEAFSIQTEKDKIDCIVRNMSKYFANLYHLVRPCLKTSWRQKFLVSVEFQSQALQERLCGAQPSKLSMPPAEDPEEKLDESSCDEDFRDFNAEVDDLFHSTELFENLCERTIAINAKVGRESCKSLIHAYCPFVSCHVISINLCTQARFKKQNGTAV